MKRIFLLTIIMVLFLHCEIYAGGYRVSTQGIKQLGMAHTGLSLFNSAETLFFNPAGMSFLENKYHFSLGVNFVKAKSIFQNKTFGYKAETKDSTSTPFNLYYTQKVGEKISVGLGIYTPYGSSVAWDDDWVGSHLIENIKLSTIFIQPTVSYKLSEKVSLGLGVCYVIGSVELERNISRTLMADNSSARSSVKLKKSGVSQFGFSVGVAIKSIKNLSIGINYRSQIILEANGGTAKFSNIPSALKSTLPDTGFNASIPLPSEYNVGISYYGFKNWTLAFDYNRTQWSAYEQLKIDFYDTPDSVNLRNYVDVSTIRFGAEYAYKKLKFRAGVYFDESPIPNGYFAPETPRNNSIGSTVGLSWSVSPSIDIDIAFLSLSFDETNNSYDFFQEDGKNISFGGTYKSSVAIASIGFSMKLGNYKKKNDKDKKDSEKK